MHGVPRFPYFWGGEEHQSAFRSALNLRYAMIPYLYSLVHHARSFGSPIARPASYNFPGSNAGFPRAVADATYMVGSYLLPADVCTSHQKDDPGSNISNVNIPPGLWYAFNSTSTLLGPQLSVVYKDVPLGEIVLFVRAGAILTLQVLVQSPLSLSSFSQLWYFVLYTPFSSIPYYGDPFGSAM